MPDHPGYPLGSTATSPPYSEINNVSPFWRCRHEIRRYTTSLVASLQNPKGFPASHKMQHTHPLEGQLLCKREQKSD